MWEGLQLGIRFKTELFTNGVPMVSCVTVRNISDKIAYYFAGEPPKIILLRGQERLLGVADPKAFRVHGLDE